MLGNSEIWDEESKTNSPFIYNTRFRLLWHIVNSVNAYWCKYNVLDEGDSEFVS
jgi:hypothetical protein